MINSRKSNIIVGCLYKHPTMDVSDFNKNYLNILLDKLSKENKQVFLLGDFNNITVRLLSHRCISIATIIHTNQRFNQNNFEIY